MSYYDFIQQFNQGVGNAPGGAAENLFSGNTGPAAPLFDPTGQVLHNNKTTTMTKGAAAAEAPAPGMQPQPIQPQQTSPVPLTPPPQAPVVAKPTAPGKVAQSAAGAIQRKPTVMPQFG